MSVPKLALYLTGQQDVLGITKNASLAIFALGTVIYLYFGLVLYKCPNCQKYPGNGWSRATCNSCQVQLKRT
jgi:hypothetical protein